MIGMLLGWLASHWLIVAIVVVSLMAIANPVAVWKAKAWILLAVVLWWGWTGHAAYNALLDKTHRAAEEAAIEIESANFAASEAARKEEQTRGRYIAGIGAAYERGLRDAQAAGDRTAADLRAGVQRFRSLWAECSAQPAGGVPGAAAGAGQPDGASAGRADSAGRIVRATEADAAKIRCLQAVALIDRGQDPGDLAKGCPDPHAGATP